MKIALVLNDDFSMWHFYKGLIGRLCNEGHTVYTITPHGPYVPHLEGLGATHREIKIYRFISPFRDVRLIWSLYKIFIHDQIDLVHNITVKPNVYGALAARLAGVPCVVGLVEGLGYAFMEKSSWKGKILRFIVSRLYWLGCKFSDRIWFVNPDDFSLFVDSNLINPDKAVIIKSGMNIEEFSVDCVNASEVTEEKVKLGIDPSALVVVMITARVVWSKGVKEFIEASEHSKQWSTPVVFLLVGPLDLGSPDAVPEAYLREKLSPHFIWEGFRSDVKTILGLSDIVTLPSYYREGLPRVLLEGLAMGKPIVTTNNVGCREVVDSGKNGFLVPVKNSQLFAEAIHKIVTDGEMRRKFGKNSRALAENQFDEKVVVQRVIMELYQLG